MTTPLTLSMDITAWIRGPRTSIGLCAWRLATALRQQLHSESALQFQTVTRRRPRSTELATLKADGYELMKQCKKLSWLKALCGTKGLYHSIDPILNPLRSSTRILTVHDCWTLWENPYQSRDFQRRQKRKFEMALDRADHVIVPSQHVENQLLSYRHALKGQITVIPWAPLASASETQSRNSPMSPLVGTYLEQKRPFFLCVANLETRKNHEILFRALQTLPDFDLILVGNQGFGWEAIEQRRQELCGNARCLWFTGLSTPDLNALYNGCLAVVLPSSDEGFGLPACEALAFNKPLVLSDIAPFREIAMSAAQYFHPKNGLSSLQDILNRLGESSQERESWAYAAASRKEVFNWERTAREHLSLYRALV